jgi:hypothetical protein
MIAIRQVLALIEKDIGAHEARYAPHARRLRWAVRAPVAGRALSRTPAANCGDQVRTSALSACWHRMHSAQHYRERAAQARRLASGISDRELQERLEGIAREYEAIAERIERLGKPKSE